MRVARATLAVAIAQGVAYADVLDWSVTAAEVHEYLP
jgi:hypothetical protein